MKDVRYLPALAERAGCQILLRSHASAGGCDRNSWSEHPLIAPDDPPCLCHESHIVLHTIDGERCGARDSDGLERILRALADVDYALPALRGNPTSPLQENCHLPGNFGQTLYMLSKGRDDLVHMVGMCEASGESPLLRLATCALEMAEDARSEVRDIARAHLPNWIPLLREIAAESHPRDGALPLATHRCTGEHPDDEVVFAFTRTVGFTSGTEFAEIFTLLASFDEGVDEHHRVVFRGPSFLRCLMSDVRNLEVVERTASDEEILLAAQMWRGGTSFTDALPASQDALAVCV